MIPWLKHWRSHASSEPRASASTAIARDRYLRALRDHGEGTAAARAALGRLMFHLGEDPEQAPTSPAVTPEAVAWRRESGAHGAWNRRRRRELAARLSALAAFANSSAERKPAPPTGVIAGEGA